VVLKVLLAYRCSHEGASNPFERILPVGVGYVHSYLRSRGVPTVLANVSGMDRGRIREILLAENPDVVGISCFTFNRSASLELARLVKSTLPGARVVLGGPHATHAGASILGAHPEVDVCVSGEGEITLDRLVRTLGEQGEASAIPGLFLRGAAGDVVSTGAAVPIADLDALPFPALYADGYGVDPRAQYPYIVTSRGCPAECTFCSSPEFWGSRVRFRSAANILDELELLKRRFGLLYVSFRDDVFALHRTRVLDLCRGMVERRLGLLWDCQTRVAAIDEERLTWMKRAGAMIVQYGIESGSQPVLDRLRKGQTLAQVDAAAATTRRVGLVLSIYLITGVPGEGEDDLAATEAMVRRIRPHDGIVTPLAVFPGTSLWEEYRAARGLDDGIWEGVGRDGVYVRPEPFTEDAILRLSSLLESEGPSNQYTHADFGAHRALVGDCHATDLMEAELCEREEDAAGAERLYADLAAREPWNPWPRLHLGRMALAGADPAGAEAHLTAALALVPESSDARGLLEQCRSGSAPRRKGKTPVPAPAGARPSGARRGARGFQSYPPPPRPLDGGDRPS